MLTSLFKICDKYILKQVCDKYIIELMLNVEDNRYLKEEK